MLQNMLITSLTPLGMKKELTSWENQPFTSVWPEKQLKQKEITRTIKKKPKRVRTAFSTEQIRALERTYSRYRYVDADKRNELARSLNIGEKCIKIWFQNRRMKEKKESSESSSDSSNESVGNETSSVASPSPQVQSEACKTEYPIQYYHCNNAYHTYQLPTYCGVPQNNYGVQTQNLSAFCNDNNIYPTHYYPVEMNYSNAEGSFNQYGAEFNNYWATNQNAYYAPI